MKNGYRGGNSAGEEYVLRLNSPESSRKFRFTTAPHIHAAPSKEQSDPLSEVKTAVSGMIAVLDEKRCLKCGICVEVCATYAILISHHCRSNKETVTINPKRCMGCGGCVAACPNKALSLEWLTPSPGGGTA
jgi:ferredoxin